MKRNKYYANDIVSPQKIICQSNSQPSFTTKTSLNFHKHSLLPNQRGEIYYY